jgi:hypothetical protein
VVGFRFERSATRRLDKHDMLARQRSKCAECSAELKSGPMSCKRCCPLAFSSVVCGPLVLHVDPALHLSATASADFDLRAHVEAAGMLKEPLALVGHVSMFPLLSCLLSSPPPSLLLLLLPTGLLSQGYLECEYSQTLCCSSCHSGQLRVIPARCALLLCTRMFAAKQSTTFPYTVSPCPLRCWPALMERPLTPRMAMVLRLCSCALLTLVGPCRAVWDWDLRPAPVCNRVASMIDANKERPLIFLNALNPRLFESVGGKGTSAVAFVIFNPIPMHI